MGEEYYSYIKNFFEKWAKAYFLVDLILRGLRKEVVRVADFKPGSRILDVCAGTASQAMAFSKAGCLVTGLDFSAEMLKIAVEQDKDKKITFIESSATRMPFSDNAFDGLSVSFGLHEMPEDIRSEVVSEMARVTSPGGIVIIVDYSLPENKLFAFFIYHFVKFYESKYYPDFVKVELDQFIKGFGLDVIESRLVLGGSIKIRKCLNRK